MLLLLLQCCCDGGGTVVLCLLGVVVLELTVGVCLLCSAKRDSRLRLVSKRLASRSLQAWNL